MKHFLPFALAASLGLSACSPPSIPIPTAAAQLGADSIRYDEGEFAITLPKGWVVSSETDKTIRFVADNGDEATSDASLFIVGLPRTDHDGVTPQTLLQIAIPNDSEVAQTYERNQLYGQRAILPGNDANPALISYQFAGSNDQTVYLLAIMTTEQGRLTEAEALAIADGFQWQDMTHRSHPFSAPSGVVQDGPVPLEKLDPKQRDHIKSVAKSITDQLQKHLLDKTRR